jgi:hypothetical protein
MTTNGTPFPTTPPPDLPPREPTRHLVVDVKSDGIIHESGEPELRDVFDWCEANGYHLRSKDGGGYLYGFTGGGEPVFTGAPVTKGEAERLMSEIGPERLAGDDRGNEKSFGVQCPDCGKEWGGMSKLPSRLCAETSEKAGGKMPSERLWEVSLKHKQQVSVVAENAELVNAVLAIVGEYLDRQATKGTP